MENMYILHHYEDLHAILGRRTVWFSATRDEQDNSLTNFHCALALDEFIGQVPTAYTGEIFVRNGGNFMLLMTLTTPVPREEVLVKLYGTSPI